MKRSCDPAMVRRLLVICDGAGHASTEADAVVGARNVVVHGLRNGDNFHAFLIKAHAVAQRVVAANGDEVVNAQPVKVLQDFGSQIVLLRVDTSTAGAREPRLLYLAGIGARGVQKRAASTACTVDQISDKV